MIHLAALVLYIGALLFWSRALYRGQGLGPVSGAGWITASAVAVHALALARFAQVYGELPLVGLGPALSSLALIMGLLLVSTLALGEIARVGIALLPVIVVVQGAAILLGIEPSTAVPDFQGFWFSAHVTLALAGYGGAACAFAAGLLYLIQFRTLKDKRLGRAFRFLPPLAALDRLGLLAQSLGLVALSLSLVTSWAWTIRFLGTAQVTDPKILWAVFSWGVMAAAVLVRTTGASRERRGAVASIVCFTVIVLSYLALRVGAVGGGLFP